MLYRKTNMRKKILRTVLKQTKKIVMSNNKSDRSKHADTVIRNHIIFSMGAGFIPIPVADIFAVGASQLDMIRQLCKVYDIDFQETQGKAVVSALTSSTLARIGAGSLAKAIPFVGSLIGGFANSIMAGASTYALGEVFKRHFETGGTILDFDVERLKKVYQEKFEKGKEVAKDLKEEQEAGFKAKAEEPTAPTMPNTGVIQRLKELADLKEAGILTQEEFEEMKRKILNSFS
jgi:uncharacterized protein (DUF697 family)